MDEITRWGWVITAVDDEDPEAAIAAARRQIAFYLTVKTYDPLVELHGWQDEVAAIRHAFRESPTTIGDHVSDDMLWSIAICGGDTAQRPRCSANARICPMSGSCRVRASSSVVGPGHASPAPRSVLRATTSLLLGRIDLYH